MNICFCIGEKIDTGKFKFIISKHTTHKSQYVFKFKIDAETILDVICYDNIADYMLRLNPKKIGIVGELNLINERIYINVKEIDIS